MDERVRQLAALLKRLVDGQAYNDVQKDFMDLFTQITIDELAQAENLLVAENIPIEAIQRASGQHTDLVSKAIKPVFASGSNTPDQIPGHPAFVFKGENEGITRFLARQLKPDLESFLASQLEKDRLNLLSDTRELQNIGKHYNRKENLFFPYLERSGFTAPPYPN